MNKIVELVINLEEFEFEDLGVEILSLVDRPAIEVEWMAFAEEEFEDDGADLEQFASYSDYPDSVKNNAKRGIELNKKVNNKCATNVGKQRAQQLAKGEKISEETIKRMKSYLSRAAVYYEAGDTESCGYISYLLWGGKSALTWAESKLNKIESEKFQSDLLELAKTVGEEIDPTDIVYVDGTKESFASITEILEGIKALDILERIPADLRDQEGEIKYRYTGPRGQRAFCRTMMSLNRVYSRADITSMNSLNPGFGAGGSNSYSVFKYKSGPNCQHYWEKLMQYNDGRKNVLISLGPAEGDAGKTNNANYGSPAGSLNNNGYLMSQNWSFSEDDKMIVTGPAMIPRSLIARKDELGNMFHVYFSEATIEKIARKFLADNNAHNTDINHNGDVVTENTLLESWIVDNPEMDKSKALGFNVPKGTWMTSMKINNKETWDKIKAGDLNGFSVEGSFLEIVQN